jgi:Rha family phage regulatory protein
MTQLVYIDNGRPVTDSLTVAEAFGKEHRRVMQDIRELGCSAEFRVHHFVQSEFTNGQGRQTPKYLMTEQGFALLVMGYTGQQAMEFKERYIAEFDRQRQRAAVDVTGLSPILQQLIQTEQRQAEIERRQQEQGRQIETIKETFVARDENWRGMINGLIKGAAYRQGGVYREIRNQTYALLEERGRCDLGTRLRNLKQRLTDSGATKTRVEEANKLDVIEEEPRLKEIYTSIVKELSIGTMA